MAKQNGLSRRERQIMDVVYATGQASVNHVVDQLPDPPSNTAVRTLMNILVDKGLLKQKKAGRENVYLPTRPRKTEGRSALQRVIDTFFDGSVEKALAAHLSDPKSNMDTAEIKRLAELLREQRSN